MQKIQAIRGMNDILPSQTPFWQHLEKHLRQLAAAYGYSEIRMPIVEMTALFKRSIGEATDIVEKEMYTFDDRNGDSLTLRPEGTASCVRAGIEHGLLYNQQQRLWYMGPMFRHESPQKGRYRQFHQFGVEAFGMQGPDIDAEIILMSASLWRKLGIEQSVKLQINSLGSNQARLSYREQLVLYFQQHYDVLDEDSKRRLVSNPLRILDSKNPQMESLIKQAPVLLDHLDEISSQHFNRLKVLLDSAKISYEVNPRLVRGLDYYNATVFEWISTSSSSAQNAVCSGGRYDSLVDTLGGHATPAVGFALGMERIIILLEEQLKLKEKPKIYLLMMGEAAEQTGFILAENLRQSFSNINVVMDCGGGGFKNKFKRADKSGAQLALIIGDDELANNSVSIKYLREDREQISIAHNEIHEFLAREVLI